MIYTYGMIFGYGALIIAVVKLFSKSIEAMEARERKKEILWPVYESHSRQASDFHYLLYDKIMEMDENLFTTESDWRAMLEICEYSDEWFRRACPGTKFRSLVGMVRSIMY